MEIDMSNTEIKVGDKVIYQGYKGIVVQRNIAMKTGEWMYAIDLESGHHIGLHVCELEKVA
jgi:co-chaperonin GroES (HSP10)